MSAKGLLVGALAAWRLTTLITEDRIAQPVRGQVQEHGPEWSKYLVTCRACVSVWAGLAIASGVVPKPVVWGLAASAGVLIVDRAFESIEGLVVAANRR